MTDQADQGNTDKQKFAVKTERFEGPFDALLTMIEKKKLHISEVSLAEIADDYISYVREHEFVLREATIFIWTAATLMLIKSRHLLPQFNVTTEEEEDVSGLQMRLRIYAVFKKQMEKIEILFGKNRIYPRIYRKHVVVKFRPDSQITLQQMRTSVEEAFATVEPETFMPAKAVARQRSLREVIDDVAARVKQFVRINFHELISGGDRKETAVSFLAVLELFKQGEVDVEQAGAFGTIAVSTKQINS